MKNMIIIIFLFILTFNFFSNENYYPKIGDNVILVFHLIKRGRLNEAKEFFNNTFLSNLKDPAAIKKILFLENLDDNEIVIIAFSRLEKNENTDLSKDNYNKEVKSLFIADTTSASFRLLTNNDESYNPMFGDIVAIWEYNYNAKNVEDAVKIFNKDIFPVLSNEECTKKSYLLTYRKLGVYAGITMYSGRSEDYNLIKENIKKLNKFFWRDSNLKFIK